MTLLPGPSFLAVLAMLAGAADPTDGAPGGPRSRALASPAGGLSAFPVEPVQAGQGAALRIYPWLEGTSYRLRTAPGHVSEIALQPGETLTSVAAGDTARWIIGDTTSGSGATRRTHILVKPASAELATNLLIATDRRLYRIELRSRAGSPAAGIAWTYPQDALLALAGGGTETMAASPAATAIAVDRLNFGYRIGGDRPAWRPVRAFDDGRQVFIQFPEGLRHGEAPPLFVIGTSGRAELVNYRVAGLYYVVDRLFARAELRMGERRQQVVTITLAGGRGDRGTR